MLLWNCGSQSCTSKYSSTHWWIHTTTQAHQTNLASWCSGEACLEFFDNSSVYWRKGLTTGSLWNMWRCSVPEGTSEGLSQNAYKLLLAFVLLSCWYYVLLCLPLDAFFWNPCPHSFQILNNMHNEMARKTHKAGGCKCPCNRGCGHQVI